MENTKKITGEDELQGIIDVDKWLRSEQAGRDLCGKSSYCGYCDKAEKNPCARAALREKKSEETAVCKDEDGYVLATRYRRSFTSRLIQNETVQELYTLLKNRFMSLKGVKSRTGFNFESFRMGRELLARLAVRGKTLCVFLALDPREIDGKNYRTEDVSDKKAYADVPLKMKITSRRAAKRAGELIDLLAARKELTEGKPADKNYRFAYKTDDALIEKGLIKPYTVRVKA